MRTCPSCGKPVASNAHTCQSCGHRFTTFAAKVFIWLVLAPLILAILAGFILSK